MLGVTTDRIRIVGFANNRRILASGATTANIEVEITSDKHIAGEPEFAENGEAKVSTPETLTNFKENKKALDDIDKSILEKVK